MTVALSADDGRVRRRRRTRTSRSLRQSLIGWSFAFPFVALFAVFMAGPILVSLATSFTDMRVTDIRDPLDVGFVGLDNYRDVLNNPDFRKAAWNTVKYVVVAVPLTIGLGLLVAVALNHGWVRFRNWFRLAYFLPYVTSIVAISVVWRMLLGTDAGLFNALLDGIGVQGPGWLSDPAWALWSIVAMTTWRGLGLQMVIFLAGLQAIPKDLYEAAAVDGATGWQKFRHVTLPMLRPTLLFSTVIATIGLLQFFEEPFVMTQGGPRGSTVSVAYHAYEQFSFGDYGYTAAASYLLFLVIAVLTLIQFRVLRPKV